MGARFLRFVIFDIGESVMPRAMHSVAGISGGTYKNKRSVRIGKEHYKMTLLQEPQCPLTAKVSLVASYLLMRGSSQNEVERRIRENRAMNTETSLSRVLSESQCRAIIYSLAAISGSRVGVGAASPQLLNRFANAVIGFRCAMWNLCLFLALGLGSAVSFVCSGSLMCHCGDFFSLSR